MEVYPIYEIYINKETDNMVFKKYNGIKNTHYHLFIPLEDKMKQMEKGEFEYCKGRAHIISKEQLLSYFKDSHRRNRKKLINMIEKLNVRDVE